MQRLPHRRGLTLIELMIVVAILSVLAAIAVVSYGAYTRRARAAQLSELLGNIATAQESFRQFTGAYFDTEGDWCPDDAPTGTERAWGEDCTELLGQLGIGLPWNTQFSVRIWAFRPGAVCDVEVPNLDLDPCALPGMGEGHRWVAVGMGNQTRQDEAQAFHVITNTSRGLILTQQPYQ